MSDYASAFDYWKVIVVLILIGRALLHCFIFPPLRRRGIPYEAGSGDHRAVSEFRRICLAEGRPLTLWYLMNAYWVIFYGAVIGWFCLIIYRIV